MLALRDLKAPAIKRRALLCAASVLVATVVVRPLAAQPQAAPRPGIVRIAQLPPPNGLPSWAPIQAQLTEDVSAVEAGRSRGRAILILRNPVICAPVMLVERCLKDLSTLVGPFDGNAVFSSVPGVGAKPFDRLLAYIREGDPANIDRALSWESSATAPPGLPTRQAELTDAGIAATLFAGANGQSQWRATSLMTSIDAAHMPAIPGIDLFSPAQRSLLASLKETEDARGRGIQLSVQQQSAVFGADAAFAHRVDELFPAHALLDLQYGDSDAGNIRIGIAFATLGQMLELPPLSVLPESREFATNALDGINKVAPGPETETAGRDLLDALSADDPETRHKGIEALHALTKQLFSAETRKIWNPLMLGFAVAMLGYEAGVVRKPANSATDLAHLTAIMNVPSMKALYGSVLSPLLACDASDFACQRLASTTAAQTFARL